MTRAFRKRLLQQAFAMLVGVGAVLLILAGTIGEKAFLIAAAILIPAAALTFNFLQRRAYAATRGRR